MTPRQKLTKQFIDDKSVVKFEVLVDYGSNTLLVLVSYNDSRGIINNYTSEVMHCDFIYGCFLAHKARQHWEDYREYLVIKTETTFGKELEPSAFSNSVTYQKGDQFVLNGYTCVVTDVEKKRDYYISEVSYERSLSHAFLGRTDNWIVKIKIVKIKKSLLNIYGKIEETYHINEKDLPKLGNFKTNDDWYDALMEVVNKR